MGLSAGTKLGPYEILAPLGAGGMGEVYRARDTRLGRDVAVKVLPEDVAIDPKALARFEGEARAVAALSHPNILALHDVGKEGAVSYVVTELLEGETLRDLLGRGPLTVRKVLDVALQVAEGLSAAHEKGIVHRDVKPENVFLTKEGHAKLLDFGLARHDVTHHEASDTRSPTLAAVSEKGVVLGTVAYMSPEQARGEAVDFRSDQFSLGTVLYEMLTGKRPFEGTSAAELLAAIIRDEPEPVTKLDPKLPALLGWIIQRCLSKDPEERYSATRDFVKELQNLRTHLSEAVSATDVAPGKAPRLRRRVPVWALLAVAVLAVVVGLLLGTRFLKRSSPPVLPVRLSLSFPLDVAPTLTGNFNPFALSPDGKTLVYAGRSLYVRRLDSDETKPIPGTDGAVNPFFSPDGLWVGFLAEGILKKVPLEGGPPIPLCDSKESLVGGPGAGGWGADGTIVFMPSSFSGLRRVPASGGECRTVTTVDTGSRESHLYPQILPDGENVLFQSSNRGPSARPRAEVVSLRTGERRVVAEDAGYPRYLPTGHLVFTRGGALFAAPFSMQRLEVSGLAVPVLDDLVTNRNYSGAAHIALSSEGTLLYAPRGHVQRTLVWVDRKGAVEPLPFPPGNYVEAVLSPDGGRLAAIVFEKRETIALLIGELARGTLTRSPAEGVYQGLAWAPDGKRIAVGFVAEDETHSFRPRWFGADGSTPLEPFVIDAEPQLQLIPASFSPDGSVLLLVGFDYLKTGPSDTSSDIYVLPLTGEKKRYAFLQTRFYETNARFSPDGRWVAYRSNESGRNEVFVRPFPGPGPKWQISAEGGAGPRWSRGGRELFYRNGDKTMAVDVETQPAFRAGRPRLLFEAPHLWSYDVAPDGTRFLMIRRDPSESGPPRVNVVLNWFEELKRRVPGAK
jgi:eukaryotic-like serine/threonine-protein kinase